MLVVALTRLGPRSPGASPAPVDLEAEVAALAPVLGKGSYELRLTLAGAPPLVLLSTPAVETARELLALLRGRGHGAVACEASTVTSSDQMASPRELRLEPDRLVVEVPGAPSHSIAYQDILLIAEAMYAREEETIEERSEENVSISRAVVTAGLIRTRSKSVSARHASESRERVLYVIHARGEGHVLLREQRLRYGGLGPRIGRTVGESFTSLRAMLLERAPGALHDDRLVRGRRAAGSLQISGSMVSRTVARSNASETDLAVHLIAVAHLQGQL